MQPPEGVAEQKQDQKPDHEKREEEEAEQRSAPKGSVVYQAICKEGQDELGRSTSALWWSGLAAGLSMGFSFLVPALLHAHLPDEKWRPLLADAGYTIGFLIVVLGRQQLFTENTLTVILPLLQKKDRGTLMNVLRLWGTVLAANLAGAIVFAVVLAKTRLVDAGVHHSLQELATVSMSGSFVELLLRGIFAGWLIALMVWLMPASESQRVWVIVIITYVVALAGLAHVIAGSIDAAYLAIRGLRTWNEFLVGFTLPSLIGNIIGGVALVAALNHAQVVSGEGESADV